MPSVFSSISPPPPDLLGVRPWPTKRQRERGQRDRERERERVHLNLSRIFHRIRNGLRLAEFCVIKKERKNSERKKGRKKKTIKLLVTT